MERCKQAASSEDNLGQTKPPAKEDKVEDEDEGELFSCFICMDEYRPSSVFTISTCSHQFCRTCMSTYVVSKINSNMVGPRGMVCPDPYCKEEERSLTEDDMRLVLSTQSWRFRQYLKLRNRYLIDSDPNMKWCNECSDGVVGLNKHTWKWSVPCSNENCHAKCCPRCALPSHPFTTCSRAMQRHTGMYMANNNCKRCPSCNSMIEKDGGCNHMTCSQCGHNFCWLCRGNWRSGCKNKFCRPNDFLNRKLGCTAPVLKPVVVVVGTPVGIGLGAVAVGVGIACAGVAGALAIPFFIGRVPYRWHKERQRRRELLEVRRKININDRYAGVQNAQGGVGLTFVGASQEFQNYVQTNIQGRLIGPPGQPPDTFIAWREFPINVAFRSVDPTLGDDRIVVADFEADFDDDADEGIRGQHKPHFVYMMHGITSTRDGQSAYEGHLIHHLRRWRNARTRRRDRPSSLSVMDYRTEMHLLNASSGGMPEGDILGQEGLSHAQVFEMAEIHVMEQLGYINREESLSMAARCVAGVAVVL
mmetsp:Transcript_26669/g.50548  ORF Transcript_26669/g.50548 Transcript_26669/m.50548 type:complete len:531 (-) Transcript_26669:991-2583(-)